MCTVNDHYEFHTLNHCKTCASEQLSKKADSDSDVKSMLPISDWDVVFMNADNTNIETAVLTFSQSRS